MGINWSLVPGGVITRQVRDQPDEKINRENKFFYTKTELDALSGAHNYSDPSTLWFRKLESIGNNTLQSTQLF